MSKEHTEPRDGKGSAPAVKVLDLRRAFSHERPNQKAALPWIGLSCILIIYLVSVFVINPLDLFGTTEDDAIYFSSAKALANHQGYILPSLPGGPIATNTRYYILGFSPGYGVGTLRFLLT